MRCNLGNNIPINVEYVSANPLALCMGHALGAVFGNVLANLLEKVGYRVTREYYINDAKGQVDILARSVYLRYCAALGSRSPFQRAYIRGPISFQWGKP